MIHHYADLSTEDSLLRCNIIHKWMGGWRERATDSWTDRQTRCSFNASKILETLPFFQDLM